MYKKKATLRQDARRTQREIQREMRDQVPNSRLKEVNLRLHFKTDFNL